jgi:hypothetical protein
VHVHPTRYKHMSPSNEISKETLNQLLEQAVAEPDRERFLELLREIGQRIARTRGKGRPLKAISFRRSMETETFDLFAGPPDRNAVWRESVVGIDPARKRMEEIAATFPGEYFIFHEASRAVVARTNSQPVPATAQRARPAHPTDVLPFPDSISAA